MAQAYDRIIATITTASDASQVVKAMVKSTEWRAGTSGDWNATDCTLTASNVYQFRTPLSGMDSGSTTILPNIKASVVVDWDATATAITTVGNYFMYYYASSCSSLTSLSVPDTSGLTSVGDNFMRNYASSCSSLTSLSVPDTSGLTTVGTYFMAYYANGCSSLTSLSVPDTSGLKSVGNYFMRNYASYCTLLTSLSVPDTSGLKTVGTYFMAYYADSCTSLTSLSVPDTSGLTTVGTNFMAYYANGCSSLTSLLLPSTTGWFASNNVSWRVLSARLGYLKGYAPNSTAQTAWQALTVSGKTLYTNYIQSEDDVEVTAAGSNDYTLTCAAGSYSLTGTNVTLTHTPASQNLTLACNAGTYSLTGTNADLTVTRHYTLTCEAGSYALTGTNADLAVKRNYVLNAVYPDMLISGLTGGVAFANGCYEYAGIYNNKPEYGHEGVSNIYWSGDNKWVLNCGGDDYESTDDVATPDLVTIWTDVYGYGSMPTVTAANAYKLTGTDVTLTYTQDAQSYTLTCSAGSYGLTGTNADLTVKRNYVLNLAYPDIIVSGAGTPVEYVNGTYEYFGLNNGRPEWQAPLDGWNGAVYWAGGSYGWMISTAGGGTEFYSTDDVATPDLVTTWTDGGYGAASLPTVTGNSYKLTGTDVTLTVQRNYTLVCEFGSYTLTGTDITFGNTTAYTLTCEAGAYTLTGSSVSFVIQRNYSLACEAGSYSLTGTDVTLTYTQGAQNYTLACETGSYALTGTNAGLTSARTMACNAGSYALTGTNADLYRSLVMACNAGSYALTGSDVAFNANYIFALGMGSYVLVGTNAGLFILSPTPACRTATIEYENRTFAIPHENRTLEVKCH